MQQSEIVSDDIVLATPLRRLGAYTLDVVLGSIVGLIFASLVLGLFFVVDGFFTFLLGLVAFMIFLAYAFWWVICLRHGQSPGKKILNLYVIRSNSMRAGGWYMFLREHLIKGILFFGIASSITFYIVPVVAAAWLLWDKDRQTLWDKVVATTVIYVPSGERPLTQKEVDIYDNEYL